MCLRLHLPMNIRSELNDLRHVARHVRLSSRPHVIDANGGTDENSSLTNPPSMPCSTRTTRESPDRSLGPINETANNASTDQTLSSAVPSQPGSDVGSALAIASATVDSSVGDQSSGQGSNPSSTLDGFAFVHSDGDEEDNGTHASSLEISTWSTSTVPPSDTTSGSRH